MGARKLAGFPVMNLGMTEIVVDHTLQSRVSTSVEYQRDFSESMLRGDEFPPVTVFFDGRYYRLADGFHRYGARKILARSDRSFEQIKAEVRDGGRKEALIFSAGANQKFSIPRTAADTKKAVYMLLEFPEWLNSPVADISKHCGVSAGTVAKYRASYCEENGIDLFNLPSVSNKAKASRRVGKGDLPFYEFQANYKRVDGTRADHKCYKTRVNGKTISLGWGDEEAARKKWRELNEKGESREQKRRRLDMNCFMSAAALRDLIFQGFIGDDASKYPGLNGLVGCGCTVVLCRVEGRDSLVDAVGRIILAREYLGRKDREVIVTYLEPGMMPLAELAISAGFEVLEPDVLFASLHDRQGDQ